MISIFKNEKMIIGNEFVDSSDHSKIINPYTGEIISSIPEADEQQVYTALRGAELAGNDISFRERNRILAETANHFEKCGEIVAKLIVKESGISIKDANHEVKRSIKVFRYAAYWALQYSKIEWLDIYNSSISNDAPKMEIICDPVSLAVSITPFNHPLNQVAHKVAPAIAAGASLVLKPSEKTPLTALYLGKVLIEKGLPPNKLNIITGKPNKIVPQLVSYKGAEVISFTGSVEIGKKISEYIINGGNHLTRYIPELGGNAGMLVMSDASIELSARIAMGAFENSGQRCTAIKRIFVHEKIADLFIECFLSMAKKINCGNPEDPNTDIGTVIDENAALVLEQRIDSALSQGGKLLLGNIREGALFHPTIIDKVTPQMEIIVKETFGPVAPIIRISSMDDAIDIVKSSGFRLAGAIITSSYDTAKKYADAIKVGQFSWNGQPGYRTEEAPFGGFGDSGNGSKEGVICSIGNLLHKRTFYSHEHNCSGEKNG